MTYRGRTDRRFNDYHYTWPKHWSYIDIDGIEVCGTCRSPLILYETTRNEQKSASIIAELAHLAGINAVLILVPEYGESFTDDTEVAWKWVVRVGVKQPYPLTPWTDGTLADWRSVVERVRIHHDNTHHPWMMTKTQVQA